MSSPLPGQPPSPPSRNDPREQYYFDLLMRRRVVDASGIPWVQVDKTGSSLADLATRTHALLTALTADDHTQYLHLTIARTVTAQHTLNTGAGNAPFVVTGGVAKVANLDADKLDGLDSTALAILAGQSGGQTLNGDTAASGNLTLSSTAHATKGEVRINDSLKHTGTKLGVFNTAPVVQQTVDAVTNNVTAGGVNGTIANFTDLATYANDAATIRNDIYQLARSVQQLAAALRTYGLAV